MFRHKFYSTHQLFVIGILFLSGVALVYSSVREPASNYGGPEPKNCIYHWKTVYNPSTWELDFLKRHNITRMYVKMFDVDVSGYGNIVPIVTTKFCQPLPEGVEFVPTVYITNEAVSWMDSEEVADTCAFLIVKRLKAMANHNKLGRFKEVQIDCDWSRPTCNAYFGMLSQMRELLHADTIALSVTLRLHQVRDPAPPVDRVTLMLYNTGQLMSPKSKNSILDIEDVKPYLRRKVAYNIPVDFAYPAFRWGVMFRDNQFERLVSNPDAYKDSTNVRIEESNMDEILATKHLVTERLVAFRGNNMIYHLDSLQLSRFSDNDIRQIFSHP